MMNAANTDGIHCFWWGCVVCSLFRRICNPPVLNLGICNPPHHSFTPLSV